MATGVLPKPQPCVLFIDAYDSFSENIIALLRRLLHVTIVSIKIDESLTESPQREWQTSQISNFDAIVVGPGPGSPDSASDTGHLNHIWEHATTFEIPVLGICLGFQALCSRFGLPVTQLDLPCHGHARQVLHKNQDIFKDAGTVIATSYNSLAVLMPRVELTTSPVSSGSSISENSRPSSSCSSEKSDVQSISERHLDSFAAKSLNVIAWNTGGYVMAVKHTSLPFWGLQFHPESCLSNDACQMVVSNWWEKAQMHRQRFQRTRNMLPKDFLPQTPNTGRAPGSDVSDISRHLATLVQHCAREVSYICFATSVNRLQLADLCQSLSNTGRAAMLESSRRGRFSIYAFSDDMSWLLQQQENCLQTRVGGIMHEIFYTSINNTMEAIESFMAQHLTTGGDPVVPFWGGLLGTLSYEGGLDLTIPIQHRFNVSKDPREIPDLSLMWVDRTVILDNKTQQLYIQTLRKDDRQWLLELSARIRAIAAGLKAQLLDPSVHAKVHSFPTTIPSQPDYKARIGSCQAQLHAGNSYELCLTTSATITTVLPKDSTPYTLYRSLQRHNPSAYSAYLSLNSLTVLSSSPEHFLSWSRSLPHLDMMPMKGTLAKTPGLQPREAKKLLCTPKEEAENLMIADLIRHDLNRSLGPDGVIEVKSLYELVETENTYQLISHLRGHIPLPGSPSALLTVKQQRCRSTQIMQAGHKALRTSLPPGSMTGAPKIRSCSILAEVEQRNRGVYSGVIGYFDVGGGGCWSVAIRCAFSDDSQDQLVNGQKDQRWHVGAGGAITVLSDDEQEWEEMAVKMNGVLKGFGVGDEVFP